MDIIGNNLQFNPDAKEWILTGVTEKKITSVQLFFNEVKEYVHPATKIDIPISFSDNKFTATIDLSQVAKKSLNYTKTNWKLKAFDGESTYLIQADGPIHYSPNTNTFDLFSYHFNFPRGEITLTFEPILIQSVLKRFSFEEKMISGAIQFSSLLNLENHSCMLTLKRRTSPDHYHYHDINQSFSLGEIKNNQISFSLLLKDLSPDFLIDEKNILDALISISFPNTAQRVSTFIEIDSTLRSQIALKTMILHPLYALLSAYVTGSNRLSFSFMKKREEKILLTSYKENEEAIHLQFKFTEQLEHPSLVLKRNDKKGNRFEYVIEQEFPLSKSWKLDKTAKIVKEALFLEPFNKTMTAWDFFIRSKNYPDFPVTVIDKVDLSKNTFFPMQNTFFQAQMIKNPRNILSCQMTKAPREALPSAKKLAIMGACFSRNAFNTSPYFNPDYKQFFECRFTQFHSSIVSIMSKPYAGEIDLDRYSDMIPSEKGYVKQDIEKNFFSLLKAANADYFLIDLYPDVIRPVIWLNAETAITLSYIVEKSELLNDLPIARLLDHENELLFFSEWKFYVKEFIKKLLEIFPEDRIILNKGGFTTTYYNEKGVVTPYKNKISIERNNVFWDRLNNYFLAQIPKAKVIDFSKKRYIGDATYPFGHSFSHFESEYYKDFLKELIYLTK